MKSVPVLIAGGGPGGADALYVVSEPLVTSNRIRINTLAQSARLPTIPATREFVEAGGLMSYGPNYSDQFRRTAHSCPGRVRRHVRRNSVTLTAGDEAACFWGDILVSRFFGSSLEIVWASCASTDITKTAPPGKHRNRAYVGSLRTRALSPEISQIEKDDPSVRVIVTQGGAIAESRTLYRRGTPIQAVPAQL
jgi:hypothetical protein